MSECRDPLPDHAPADKFVYSKLREADDPLTRLELQRVTGLAGRTVRRSLKRLRESGHVERNWHDPNKPRYSVAGQNGQTPED